MNKKICRRLNQLSHENRQTEQSRFGIRAEIRSTLSAPTMTRERSSDPKHNIDVAAPMSSYLPPLSFDSRRKLGDISKMTDQEQVGKSIGLIGRQCCQARLDAEINQRVDPKKDGLWNLFTEAGAMAHRERTGKKIPVNSSTEGTTAKENIVNNSNKSDKKIKITLQSACSAVALKQLR